MADIDNGYDEKMPEEVIIKLIYEDSISRNLALCEIPNSQGMFLNPVNVYRYGVYFPDVCVSREVSGSQKFNTLARNYRTFLYMDVGRWGGSEHRDFGVVCGNHAAICKFHRNGYRDKCLWPNRAECDSSTDLIERLLSSMCTSTFSPEIVKAETIYSDIQPRPGPPVYLFLGDLHLPVFNSAVNPRKYEHYMGRILEGGGLIGYGKDTVDSSEELNEWYNKYREGDIFEGGTWDLLAFLSLLEKSPEKDNVHFVQVGDMYELWLGLNCFFMEDKNPPGKVYLNPYVRKPSAREFINHWIRQANECNQDIITKLKNLKVMKKTFLYGNHDNYLAVYAPDLQKRQRYIRDNRLYIEHGHWADPSNYDGSISGHSITNHVFKTPSLRHLDPNSRYFFTTAAAIEYVNSKDFSIFVMAHTHSPYLTQVSVKTELWKREYIAQKKQEIVEKIILSNRIVW